ncbi:MAG: TldD/PmbA family protein [Candidatus Aenigmarchaeota archaeon]|nr:TldD/PmbA family protein [Candidatus Aenigmarchaeota archaeon]
MEPRDLMEKIVRILEKTYYGDVRFEKGNSFSIGKKKTEENIDTASSIGLCIRIISDNRWHYLGFNEMNEEKILDETEKLVRRVGSKPSKLVIKDPLEIDEEIKVKKKPEDVSVEEKVKTVRETFEFLMRNEKIVNASVIMAHASNETLFMNTEGSVLRQVLPFFRFSISSVAKEGKRIEYDYYVLARQGGYELFTSIDLNEKIKDVVDGSIQMLKAKVLKGGRHDIIVDPEISGVIAHESFGHGCEADQVLRGRSYLAALKGKKIISDLVSIHDNSSLKGERGYFVFDDEGIKSSDTVLVKNGVLTNFLHDRQSAAFMNSDVTGNARAQDFSRKVFVRMSNTYIEPGDWKHDELVEDTDSGFYLMKAMTGMEDPLGGNLQIVTFKAREIKNGELGELYKGVGISGKVLEFLSRVDAVTDDFEMRGSGCGKGHEDYVPVSSGGPYMRVRKAIIG